MSAWGKAETTGATPAGVQFLNIDNVGAVQPVAAAGLAAHDIEEAFRIELLMLCRREMGSEEPHATLLWRFARVEGCPERPQQSGHRDVSLTSLQLRNEEDLLGFSIKVCQQFAELTVLAEGDCAKALQSKIAKAHFGACNLSYVVGIELMSSIASVVHDDLDVHEGSDLAASAT
jgi:hypothetical protein